MIHKYEVQHKPPSLVDPARIIDMISGGTLCWSDHCSYWFHSSYSAKKEIEDLKTDCEQRRQRKAKMQRGWDWKRWSCDEGYAEGTLLLSTISGEEKPFLQTQKSTFWRNDVANFLNLWFVPIPVMRTDPSLIAAFEVPNSKRPSHRFDVGTYIPDFTRSQLLHRLSQAAYPEMFRSRTFCDSTRAFPLWCAIWCICFETKLHDANLLPTKLFRREASDEETKTNNKDFLLCGYTPLRSSTWNSLPEAMKRIICPLPAEKQCNQMNSES